MAKIKYGRYLVAITEIDNNLLLMGKKNHNKFPQFKKKTKKGLFICILVNYNYMDSIAMHPYRQFTCLFNDL